MVKTFDALGAHAGREQEWMDLWLRCNTKLEENPVDPLTAVKFFEVCPLILYVYTVHAV